MHSFCLSGNQFSLFYTPHTPWSKWKVMSLCCLNHVNTTHKDKDLMWAINALITYFSYGVGHALITNFYLMVLATYVFWVHGNIFFWEDGRSQGKEVFIVLVKLGLLYSPNLFMSWISSTYNLTSISTALLALRGSIAVWKFNTYIYIYIYG